MPSRAPHKLRILHVVWNFEFGGLENVVADLANGLDPEDFETHVLSFGRFRDEASLLRPTIVRHIAVPQERWSLLHPQALADQIRGIAPDIVHSHSGVWYKTAKAARLARIPLVVHTDHGRRSPDPIFDRVIDGLASRRTDAIVAVSEVLAVQLRRLVADPETVQTIPNGVNTDVFSPATPSTLRRELGLADDVPIIGSIGRLEPIKAYDVMLTAFAKLLRSGRSTPDPILVLVGDGSRARALEHLAHELHIAPQVRMLGWRTDNANCHRAFDIFSISSASEGTSIGLLEAMSSGVCPVATAVGGTPSVVGPELGHRLVPPGDPDALAHGWESILYDREARLRDAALARSRVIQNFSVSRMIAEYARLYDPNGRVGLAA